MKKTFPIQLTEELHKQIKHAAIDAGMTLHDWLIKTLEEKLASNANLNTTRPANHDRRKN